MANDVEDFGDFASAFPPNGATNGENFTQGTTSGVSQVNTMGNMDFFASLPAPTLSTSGVTDPSLDFASFDAFTKHNTGGVGLGEIPDFGQFDVANVNLAELKIPSPTHDSNVHLVGGVAFDIPPIPDDDFSDPGSPTVVNNRPELQHDLFSINTALPVDKNESSMNVHLSFPSSLAPLGGQQEQDGKGNAVDDDFGDFESSLSITKPNNFTESSNVGSNFALFEDNSISASSVAGSNAQETTKFGQLHRDDKSGEFGGFTTSTTIAKTESSSIAHLGNSLDVGSSTSFESTSTTKVESKESESNNELVPEMSRTDDSAGFANFQSSEATKTNEELNQFGDFGVFAGVGTTTAQEDDFGDFRTQTSSSTAPLPTTTAHTKVDGFGAFADSTGKADEFGAFASTSSGDAFGAFADGKHSSERFGVFTDRKSKDSEFGAFAESESKGDNFGAFTGDDSEFGAFAEGTSKDSEFGAFTDITSKGVEAFGTFAGSLGKDDEFGEFSSTGESKFGDFSSSVAVPPIARTSGDEAKHKDTDNVILSCFPRASSLQEKQAPHSTHQFVTSLSAHQPSDSSESNTPMMSWTSLQKSVDYTIPLKKWEQSYMQDHYFGALKIDPMLVSKAGVLPWFNGMGQFEAPLGGITALDLMESFGFEEGLEVMTQEPSSPTSGLLFRQRASGSPGPALLDLSLPSSPRSPTNKDASFILDADLLGLDLNPQAHGKQLTSIQELVLNEQLVVNRSTWMDSELLELGGSAGNDAVGHTSSTLQTSSQPSTPRTGKKQNSIELQLLQLGLDASKTSFANALSHAELSLTARSTLGRLPDLSFMLQRDKLVRSTYQPGKGKT